MNLRRPARPEEPGPRLGLVLEIGDSLVAARATLRDYMATPEGFAALMKRHGWKAAPATLDMPSVRDALAPMIGLDPLRLLITEARAIGDVGLVGLSLRILDAIQAIPAEIEATGRRLPAQAPPLDAARFWREFPRELIDELIVDQFALKQPLDYAPLLLTGYFIDEIVDAPGSGRSRYSRRRVHWERFRALAVRPPA
jgi:hypothetical protein